MVFESPKIGCNHPCYNVWIGMIARCENKKNKRYHRYGGRGITICERWRKSFRAFIEDMGDRPSAAYTLDRKNNNGNYDPGNCRWATKEEQNNNTSSNRTLTLNGETLTVHQWARKIGIRAGTLEHRLKAGWSVEDALTKPLMTLSESARLSTKARVRNRSLVRAAIEPSQHRRS